MKNKEWGITLAALVIGLILLAGGFSIYARKAQEKRTISSPDGSMIVKVTQKKNGESFLIEECDSKGKMETQFEWPGKLLALQWTKDGSKYVINREETAGKKIEVEEVTTTRMHYINNEVKEGLYEFLQKQHKTEPEEDATLSLEFQSWCDDNEAMVVKYEVGSQDAKVYSGYLIYNITDKLVGSVYEIK